MDGRNTFNTNCLLDFLFGCGFTVGGLCGLYLLLQSSFTWPMLILDSLFCGDYSHRDSYYDCPVEAASQGEQHTKVKLTHRSVDGTPLGQMGEGLEEGLARSRRDKRKMRNSRNRPLPE